MHSRSARSSSPRSASLYAGARQTSVFGLETIEVKGAPREVKRDVRAALAPLEGTSLVALDPGEVERMLAAVPVVKSAHVDRAFPHTLTIGSSRNGRLPSIAPAPTAWLVAESGRVLATLEADRAPALPRIRTTVERDPTVGASLAGDEARPALAVLAAVPRRLPGQVLYAQIDETGVTLVLAETNQEIRLGEPRDVEQKLAAAVAVLRALPPRGAGARGVRRCEPARPRRHGPFSQPSSESSELD